MPAPANRRWDTRVLDAVWFVLHANNVSGVRSEVFDGDEVVWFSSEAVAVLLDAASGDHFEPSRTGSWADSIVLAAAPDVRLDVAGCLADAADHFDAIAWAALNGPVRFGVTAETTSF